MRKLAVILLIGVAIAGCVRSGKTMDPQGTSAPAGGLSASVLPEVNAFRAGSGLTALADDARLARAAQAHADDMASKSYFNHTGADGSSVGDRVKRQGYGFCFVAENIAQGMKGVTQVLSTWQNSQGHRKNILSPHATQFGLARSGTDDYWVMVLGKPGC